MIQAVLFDMDGLIVDTEPIHFKAFREMMQSYGHEIPESLMAQLVGFPEADNIRDLRQMYQMEAPAEEMSARRYGRFMQLIRVEPIPVFPGFWEFSEQVRRRGLKRAVVSSSTAEQVEVILGRLFAEHGDAALLRQRATEATKHGRLPETYFDAVVTGDDIARNKPAPDIYLLAAERLRLPPADCLVLEDTPPGVQAAVSAGCVAIAVPNDYSRGLEFPGAAAVIGSLHEAAAHLGR